MSFCFSRPRFEYTQVELLLAGCWCLKLRIMQLFLKLLSHLYTSLFMHDVLYCTQMDVMRITLVCSQSINSHHTGCQFIQNVLIPPA